MPPWAATPVLPLLLLLLLVQGRGGHGAITVASLEMDMDMDMGVEAQMGSEEAAAHGRLLWATGGGRRYISYDALRGDAVPCSRPGVPYYNCRVSTTANPYSRGCESITRCRDDDPS
ncbi:rapid alkalinization factor 23-like [Aegilops tauschii subsp. strangulata]|nr:rapid alkalinization factor 23-like [Aegilops tauschii subsp. strangulata]